MDIQAVASRITDLERAFQKLSRRVPGLRTEVVGHMSTDRSLVHPIAGFQVKLQHPGESAGVLLYVSASYAELTRWPSDGGALRDEDAPAHRVDGEFERRIAGEDRVRLPRHGVEDGDAVAVQVRDIDAVRERIDRDVAGVRADLHLSHGRKGNREE